jgi:hypothetical protein
MISFSSEHTWSCDLAIRTWRKKENHRSNTRILFAKEFGGSIYGLFHFYPAITFLLLPDQIRSFLLTWTPADFLTSFVCVCVCVHVFWILRDSPMHTAGFSLNSNKTLTRADSIALLFITWDPEHGISKDSLTGIYRFHYTDGRWG